MHRLMKKYIFLASCLLVIGLISYAAADRYLIQHVEIENVAAYSATTSQTKENISGNSNIAESAALCQPTAESNPTPEPAVFDDWHYSDENVSIAIRQVTSGSGNNALTYFVADVQVSEALDLSSAFALNQFGTNIIANTSQIAAENGAIFAVNGDYYGFRTDGIVIRNGVIFRDEPARTSLAFYRNGTMRIYDEMQTDAEKLLAAGVWNTLSFGPALIEDSGIGTNFDSVKIDTNLGNHPIQGNQPRTGVGMLAANHFVFIVVDGRSKGYSTGVTLEEFAQIFKELGCTQAYNIDGGGSSTMYFMGRVVNNPLGKNRERGTSDILMIGS